MRADAGALMLFWFVATAVLSVHLVFRDLAFDHRLLIVGAVLPVVGGLLGDSSAVLLSMAAPVVVLIAVMAVTAGRKPIRRTLLGLPIGMFLHLVFTGSWTDGRRFWWPTLGGSTADIVSPVSSRGFWNLPLELLGFVLLVAMLRRACLDDVARRRAFVARGTLDLSGR